MKDKLIDNIMDQIENFRDKYGDKKTVEMFQNTIIESNNNSLCYWFAERFNGVDATALGQIIINSGNAEDNYEYACNIKGADVKAHGDAILKSGSPLYNYRFIQRFGDVDRESHINAILKSGDAYYMYSLAEFTDKDNFTRYIDPIIETKNPEHICRIAEEIVKRNIEGYNIEELEQIVIDSKDGLSNYLWACTFKNCRFKEHEKVVIESKNAIRCRAFALLPGADIKKLGQVIIDSKDNESNIEFALSHSKTADIRQHAAVIIKNKDPEYNYRFTTMVYEKLDPEERNNYSDLIELHAKAVAKSKDPFYNYLFAELPGADINMHLQAVIDSKRKNKRDEYLLEFAIHFKDLDGNKIYDAIRSKEYKTRLKYLMSRDFDSYNQTNKKEIEEQSKKINKLIFTI